MRAWLLKRRAHVNNKPLELAEVPVPEPGEKEVLVKVKVCAVCRTDLHIIEGDLPDVRSPIIPGHQVVGHVEKVGSGCKKFKKGDRVGIAWLRYTCGACDYCRSGRENLCESSKYTGYHEHGGYAEFIVVHEDFAYEIPGVFSNEEASPLLCAGIIGYRALKRSNLPSGGRLGIFGFGSSAHITIQIALSRGAEVYVATRGKGHQTLASELGAAWVGDSHSLFPKRVHSAIVFAPTGDLVPIALQSLEKGGTVSLSGIHMSPVPEMEYSNCLFHEKSLTSVESNTREDGRELLREAEKIGLRPRTTIFPFESADEALISLKNDKVNGTGVLVL